MTVFTPQTILITPQMAHQMLKTTRKKQRAIRLAALNAALVHLQEIKSK